MYGGGRCTESHFWVQCRGENLDDRQESPLTLPTHRKVLLLTFVTMLLATLGVTAYNLYEQVRQNQDRIDKGRQLIERAFALQTAELGRFYTYRASSLIRTDGIVAAMERHDHDDAYRRLAGRWNALKDEDPALIVLQVHGADGRSIVRMHEPATYGDNIAALRPMLADVHRTRRLHTGFERGVRGFAFRTIVPVFDAGRYVGAVEFGVTPEYFTRKIRELYGIDTIFFSRKGDFNATLSLDEPLKNFEPVYLSHHTQSIVARCFDPSKPLPHRQIECADKTYQTGVVLLHDYAGHPIGAVMFVIDISDMSRSMMHTVMIALAIMLALTMVLTGLFSFGFRRLVREIEFDRHYFQTVFDSQSNIVVVTDGKTLIDANRSFFEFFGYRSLDHFHEEHACICDYFEEGENGRYLTRTKEGMVWNDYVIAHPESEVLVQMTMGESRHIFVLHGGRMEFEGVVRDVIVFNDVTELEELSTTDRLTGIANRLHFDSVLQHAAAVARRNGRPLSMLFFDIDYFKEINDRHGHLTGDKILIELTELVASAVRKSDLLARWGGEEFVILLPDTKQSAAVHFAQTLRMRITEKNFVTVGHLTCSFGVVTLEAGESTESLLHRADDLLYAAKRGGRNRVVAQL